jgi:hypothetical protein
MEKYNFISLGIPGEAPATTDTNEKGEFVLTSLRDEMNHWLWVWAPGHTPKLVNDAIAGQPGAPIDLKPAQPIKGKITGKLDRLKDRDAQGNPVVRYRNYINVGARTYRNSYEAKLTIKDDAAFFEIPNPNPGTVTLDVPPKEINVAVGYSTDLVVIDIPEESAPVPTRPFIVRFEGPEGEPAPEGTYSIYYHPVDRAPRLPSNSLPIVKGEVKIDVPTPTFIYPNYQQKNIPGFLVAPNPQVDVPAGDEPIIMTIPVQPAGAVHGRFLAEEGAALGAGGVTLVTVKAPEKAPVANPAQQSVTRKGRYLLTPLPFGGTYRVFGRVGSRFALSPEFTLDAGQPISEIDLQFAKGITVGGQLLGPDGKPVPDIEVMFEYSPSDEHAALRTAKTNRDGKFTLENVDPELPGKVRLLVTPGKSTQGLLLKNFKPTAEPVDLKLKAGVTAKGVLLNDTTGKPIGNRRVYLAAKDPEATYRGGISATTDAQGKFSFENVEPVTYRVTIENSMPAGTTFNRGQPIAPESPIELLLVGGQENAAEIRVVLWPQRD